LWKDLREFIDFLKEREDLAVIKDEVSVDCEISAGLQKTCKLEGPALYFESVRGHHMPVVGAIYGTQDRVLSILGTNRENVLKDFLNGMENEIPPVVKSDGPCQEIVWSHEEVDLTKLPILTNAPKDGGRYITSGVVTANDPEYGRNLSIHRCMIEGKNKLGLALAPVRHLEIYRQKAEAKGEALQVALVIGMDPVIPIASQVTPIKGGEPVELVRCRTIDMEVPATAEIVIEGEIPPNVRQMEGPFGEMSGYYGIGYDSPCVVVKAITMREDAIYHAVHAGKPPSESHHLCAIPMDASFYRYIRQICPTVKAVHFTPGGITQHHVVISLKQTYKEQAKNVMLAAYGANLDVKNVVVVDDDIDVYDPVEVEWAIATRAQAGEDVYIFPKLYGAPVDPSAKESGVVSGMAIDATKPFGEPFPDVIELPQPRYKIGGLQA
jgi:UbiD family decarboxylase